MQYLVAIPIFSLYLPVYAFWNFDDFSWGNTRVVVENGKTQELEVDMEEFDTNCIERKLLGDVIQQGDTADTKMKDPSLAKSPIRIDRAAPLGKEALMHSVQSSNETFDPEDNTPLGYANASLSSDSMSISSMGSDTASIASSSQVLHRFTDHEKDIVVKTLGRQKRGIPEGSKHVDPARIAKSKHSQNMPKQFKKLAKTYLETADIAIVTRRDVREYVEQTIGRPLERKEKKLLFHILDRLLEKMIEANHEK
jgi:anti-sigma28 factor (negative regulator of flagellin synthesis)